MDKALEMHVGGQEAGGCSYPGRWLCCREWGGVFGNQPQLRSYSRV